MKKLITKYLLSFAVSAVLLTVLFRYFLSYGIESKLLVVIVLSSLLYSITMFFTGWYFGKKDGEYLPINDVGFRFHWSQSLVETMHFQCKTFSFYKYFIQV